MTWDPKAKQGAESEKIKWELVPYTRGLGLDVGCGPTKPFQHFTGVDNQHHQVFGHEIRCDVIAEAHDLSRFASQSHDFVFSSHLLEHIEDYKTVLREWWRVIKIGGHLCLYLPHKEYYPKRGTTGANPDHKHDFLPEDIIAAMQEVAKGWDLIENQERNEGTEYSFFQVYRKMAGDKNRFSWTNPRPAKTAGVVRYGAFGDLMQAASVCAQLKREGYHVTLHASPPGVDVVKFDPNIDRIVLQDKDQVPNLELGSYWKAWEKKYDKWVNLCETVETTWLASSGSSMYRFPLSVRQKYLNGNYVEYQHEVAEIPYKLDVRFFPSAEEKDWAKKARSKMARYVILWSLAGSSVHKTWPYLDAIIARLMLTYRDVDVVLCGGPECAILEAGWEKEKRVHLTCGKWGIRQSLAFLYEADMVVGPETGVLNAACTMSLPKVCMLSHSSVENLTRDWVNTVSVFSRKTKCYPCHQLHIGWKDCPKHEETGTAKCQADIGEDQVWEPMKQIIDEAMLRAA